jgi:hypothetical protein
MTVNVESGVPPRFSRPTKLFDAPILMRSDTRNQYVPSRDGQRFLFAAHEGRPTPGATTVRLNWPAMLAK